MKYKYLLIVLLSTFFGFLSGVAGFLTFRTYIISQEFNIPLLTDINLNPGNTGNASIVISNPKKIVVEQTTKVRETSDAARKSILAIYRYDQETATSAVLAGGRNFLGFNEETAEAFVVTSDGWLVSSFVPQELADVSRLATSTRQARLDQARKKYLIIDKDRQDYKIENILVDEALGFSFWKIEARDLSVRKFAGLEETVNGQQALALNWDGCVLLSSIENKEKCDNQRIEDSDFYSAELVLADELGEEFRGSFVFNLYGDLLAVVDSLGKAIPVEVLSGSINSVLNSQKIEKSAIGVEYTDLSRYFVPGYKQNKGAYVVSYEQPAGAAPQTALLSGDIIIIVNGQELDHDNTLNKIVSRILPGEKLELEVLRGKETIMLDLTALPKP